MKKQSMIRFVLAGVVLTGLMIFSSTGWSDDTAQLKQQVQALQERVNQLESQLADKQQGEDPFAQMMQMRRQMEHNIRQAFADTGSFNPRMDMKQAKDEYIITMDVPGMDKSKINVQIKRGTLIISGERQSENQDNANNQYYRQERSFGSFLQAVPLPEDAQKDKIKASYKNGVLTVKVARIKKEEKKPEDEKITVD